MKSRAVPFGTARRAGRSEDQAEEKDFDHGGDTDGHHESDNQRNPGHTNPSRFYVVVFSGELPVRILCQLSRFSPEKSMRKYLLSPGVFFCFFPVSPLPENRNKSKMSLFWETTRRRSEHENRI